VKYITYYAHIDTLGDMSDEQAERYRAHVKEQLQSYFPHHSIDVSDMQSLNTVETNDYTIEDELLELVKNIWDHYEDKGE